MYEKFSTSKIGELSELRNLSQIIFFFNKFFKDLGLIKIAD